jgi:hypothetical protein
MGNLQRHVSVLRNVKAKKAIDILALGGSITAGGYFEYFKKLLIDKLNVTVTVHNHGHGATEITCKCVCDQLHFCLLFSCRFDILRRYF